MMGFKHLTVRARQRAWLNGIAGVAAIASLGLAALGATAQNSAAAESGKGSSFQPATPSGAYLAARHAERRFALSEAATLYARALADDPDNAELLARTLYLMVIVGRIDAALPLARRVVAKQPQARLANLVLAVDAAKRKKYADAIRHLQPQPKRGANQVLMPLMQAWLEYGAGNRDKALRTVREVEQVTGFANYYYLHSGLMLEMAGRTKAAEARYKQALADEARVGLRMIDAIGVFYERSGRNAEAAALYQKYLKRSPDALGLQLALKRARAGGKPAPFADSPGEGVAEALFDVASVVQRGRRRRQSLIYSRLALHLKSDFGPAIVLIAAVFEDRGQREEAVRLYQSVPKSSPLSWSARLAAAQALNRIDRSDEAVRILEAMARERPERFDVLVALGDLYRGKERFAQSVKAYDRAFARIPKIERRHWGLLYARGIALERSKQWKRAEKDFLKALEFVPDQPFVLNYLGYSWVEQGKNLDRARKMIE
ncbi:MAG: tetratricopeptide repeat protein, partial [Alphaproteobacteria bacterium]|nr:tetratricopeptide repeat protein [Alphaproteobacteria bacterium]